MFRPLFLSLLAAAPLVAQLQTLDTKNFPQIGKVHREDPRLDELLPTEARLEVIASGFQWCEGPVWIPAEGESPGSLLFSEIPSNTVRQWIEGKGLTIYLPASGYTGPGNYSGEPGSNGLSLDGEGRLVSCEHGDRRVSVLTKNGGKRTLADAFDGKRFNSPNDLAIKSNGHIYFTDPPYGLPRQAIDPMRELDFCGVYRLDPVTGKVTLLTNRMSRPNGIAFSPDEKTLYVAQSDSKAAIWMSFPVNDDGTVGEGKVFKDVTGLKMKGSPDGLKVDEKGNLWATGPGGVHIMASDGTLLGRLETGEATSNCAFGGPNGTTLFITADMYVCRIETKVRGAAAAKKQP